MFRRSLGTAARVGMGLNPQLAQLGMPLAACHPLLGDPGRLEDRETPPLQVQPASGHGIMKAGSTAQPR
eukprot:SAG31_NODE_302_length_18087_cov_97.056982_18_plen_69_part_00